MLETSARLLELLSLFQAQRYWSGAGLCERLEVTPRTLRRDVDRLRRLGYPVNSTSGAAGGYQLSAGASLPPLLLDDDEAVAVAVGLRTAASGTVTGIEEASLRALSKLQQVLPQRLRSRVTALQSFILPLAGPRFEQEKVDGETLAAIAGACRDSLTLRFSYRAKDGSGTERHVEPHRLVHTGRRWYLVAWDLLRGNWRTFRVDRIDIRPRTGLRTGLRFTPREPPDGDFAAYASRSFAYAPFPWRAQVMLHASAEAAAERVPPGAGTVEALGEQTCLLHTGACSLDTLSVYLALMGFEFKVLEPAELAERVRLLAGRFARACDGIAATASAPSHPRIPTP
jgi:predicted DNA-binding transcriptional regulator YafY